jgi:large subunit ribosomal protein L18
MVGLRTQKRRRKERKTDYKLRLNLLKSGLPRIVVRRTNKYFILQEVSSNQAQDKIERTVSSKDLLKEGLDKKFEGSLKSLPAGYLTGRLFAKSTDPKKEYILDLGLARTIKGNRLYAVAKGLIDGNVNVKVGESVLPSEERINAEHLSDAQKEAFTKLRKKFD